MIKFIKATFLLLAMALASTAVAVPITGSIGFAGSYTATNGSSIFDGGTQVALDLATFIDIKDDTAKVTGTVDGDFASTISAGDIATYNDFKISPFNSVSGLWNIGGFTFDLNTLNIVAQTSNILALSGTGMISSTDVNLDNTFGEWTFTANASGTNFTFSSGTAPAPGIALLIGLGLAGIGLTRRFRKA